MEIEKIKHICIELLSKLDQRFCYHNIRHTLDVYDAVTNLAKYSKLNDNDTFILKVAALFHDTGMLIDKDNHEEASCVIAADELSALNYDKSLIDKITGCIYVTKMEPYTGNDPLHMIMRDADLDYLGRKDFFCISHQLLQEWKNFGMDINLLEWYMLQIKFLNMHKYFSEAAIILRSAQKEKNLNEIINLLKK